MDNFNDFYLFNSKIHKSKFIVFIAIICFLVFPDKTFAKEINVNGYYGLINCTEIVNNNSSSIVDCSYVKSEIINGTNTVYSKLPKATVDFSGTTSNYTVSNTLFLFGYYSFTKDNYYTLNFEFDNGSYIDNTLSSTLVSDVFFGYYGSSDYIENQGLSDLAYSVTYDTSTFKGHISITFKCTKDTSSYRFKIVRMPILRNYSFQYDQFFRVYLLNAIEEEDNSNALLGQITTQNSTIINQNQEQLNQQQQINDKLDDLFDDEPLSEEVIDDFFEGIGANFTTDTPISDLILMPLTILEAYSNGISSSCSSFNLGNLFGTELIMPCVDLKSLLGSNLWTLIDSIICLFMFYNIAMLVVSIFDSLTSLEDSFQLLYTPQHGNLSRVGRGHSRGLY